MGPGLVDTAAAAGVVRLQAEMTAARAQDHQVLLAVAQIDADGDAIAAGYRSTKRFLQDALRINRAEAARLLDRAALLTPRVAMSGHSLGAGRGSRPRRPARSRSMSPARRPASRRSATLV